MKETRPETLDVAEARESHRRGLLCLGVVAGCLVVAMGMAVSSAGRGEESTAAECQRATGGQSAAAPAKRDALLLCSSESSLFRKLF